MYHYDFHNKAYGEKVFSILSVMVYWTYRVFTELSVLYDNNIFVTTTVLVSASAPPVAHWTIGTIADRSALTSLAFEREAKGNQQRYHQV